MRCVAPFVFCALSCTQLRRADSMGHGANNCTGHELHATGRATLQGVHTVRIAVRNPPHLASGTGLWCTSCHALHGAGYTHSMRCKAWGVHHDSNREQPSAQHRNMATHSMGHGGRGTWSWCTGHKAHAMWYTARGAWGIRHEGANDCPHCKGYTPCA